MRVRESALKREPVWHDRESRERESGDREAGVNETGKRNEGCLLICAYKANGRAHRDGRGDNWFVGDVYEEGRVMVAFSLFFTRLELCRALSFSIQIDAKSFSRLLCLLFTIH